MIVGRSMILNQGKVQIAAILQLLGGVYHGAKDGERDSHVHKRVDHPSGHTRRSALRRRRRRCPAHSPSPSSRAKTLLAAAGPGVRGKQLGR